MQFESEINGKTYPVTLNEENGTATVNGREISYELLRDGSGKVLLRMGTKLFKIDNIQQDGTNITLTINGAEISAAVKTEQDIMLEKLGFASDSASGLNILQAPMPGKVLDILIDEGSAVKAGEPVLILEAMKMENELKAPADGTVSTLFVAVGDSVEKNQNLLEIK